MTEDARHFPAPVQLRGTTRHTVAPIHLRMPMQLIVFLTTTLLVCLSVVLFMMESTCDQVSKLLGDQNTASLKLWENIQYFEHDMPPLTNTSMPPGLMEDLVEFSRTNANIIKAAHRLRFSHLFAPSSSWDLVKSDIKPVDGKIMEFDHLAVDPSVKNDKIAAEGWYQIELYQAIREYAQDSAAINKTYVVAISTYILPCLYALLGAFLYACRSQTQKHKGERIRAHSSRYAMAFILGATISVFSSLVPKELLLSPLAIAFVAGYSVDAFTSRLDGLVEKMKHPNHREVPEGFPPAKTG